MHPIKRLRVWAYDKSHRIGTPIVPYVLAKESNLVEWGFSYRGGKLGIQCSAWEPGESSPSWQVPQPWQALFVPIGMIVKFLIFDHLIKEEWLGLRRLICNLAEGREGWIGMAILKGKLKRGNA